MHMFHNLNSAQSGSAFTFEIIWARKRPKNGKKPRQDHPDHGGRPDLKKEDYRFGIDGGTCVHIFVWFNSALQVPENLEQMKLARFGVFGSKYLGRCAGVARVKLVKHCSTFIKLSYNSSSIGGGSRIEDCSNYTVNIYVPVSCLIPRSNHG